MCSNANDVCIYVETFLLFKGQIRHFGFISKTFKLDIITSCCINKKLLKVILFNNQHLSLFPAPLSLHNLQVQLFFCRHELNIVDRNIYLYVFVCIYFFIKANILIACVKCANKM